MLEKKMCHTFYSSGQNTLLDAIRVAFICSLKSHVETSSSKGSELASKCPRMGKKIFIGTLPQETYVEDLRSYFGL